MKLKFDAALDYQLEAIQSVTDLFEGLPNQGALFSTDFGKIDDGLYNELGIGNRDLPPLQQLLENLQQVQTRNQIPRSRQLGEGCPYDFANFSVEMETGTGKTYVYLS